MPELGRPREWDGAIWTWEGEGLGPGFPRGWYSDETPPRYGGNDPSGPQVVPGEEKRRPLGGTTEVADGEVGGEEGGTETPETAQVGPEIIQDPQTGAYFEVVPSEIPGDPSTYRRIPMPRQAQETGTEPTFWQDPMTGQQWVKSGPTGRWEQVRQPVRQPVAPEPPSLDELIVKAIEDGKWDEAVTLDDFARRPSQSQRLDQAIRYAQSPADYLAVVGMMRGEIPIGPAESPFRLGPRSEVFRGFGFGGQEPQQQGQVGPVPETEGRILGPSGGMAGRELPEAGPIPGSVEVSPGQVLTPEQLQRYTDATFAAGGLAPRLVSRLNAPVTGATVSTRGYPSFLQLQQPQKSQGPLTLQQQLAMIERELADPLLAREPERLALNQQAAGILRRQIAGFPSVLEEAYGQRILSGRATDRQGLSYPALGEAQGVPIPRFRSAQTRLSQTPLEQRLFEGALRLQGVDVPSYLAQEEFGTTPGGRRRRRVTTVSRQ